MAEGRNFPTSSPRHSRGEAHIFIRCLRRWWRGCAICRFQRPRTAALGLRVHPRLLGLKLCRYGLGMGLSIYRSIIEAHGGRLWVSPRAPHGADVRFTVPVWAEP